MAKVGQKQSKSLGKSRTRGLKPNEVNKQLLEAALSTGPFVMGAGAAASAEQEAAQPLQTPFENSRWPEQLAAIDIGSNSFRLEIAQVIRGRYRRVEYLKETVRLGGGLNAQGLLTEEAMVRGLECLSRFAQRLKGFEPRQVRAVATQTLREARNRDVFLMRAESTLGFPIEVISGREEARLIYAGVARLQPAPEPRLVIDIGGRSTELILGQGLKPTQVESFGIGSVSLSMRYFPDGKLTAEAFRAAQIAAGAELEEALETFSPDHWEQALGSSGTVGAVSQVLQANNKDEDGCITPAGLRWLIEECLRLGHVDALSGLAGVKEDRRSVIPGGLAILYTLAIHFEIKQLRSAKGALRQGVIFDLQERVQATRLQQKGLDVRDTSVLELQKRFLVDMEQARRVSAVAEALHTTSLGASSNYEIRRELLWAAALHEVGMMVSHHDHHRHSAYVLTHLDAPGFSQSQLRRLANLVLGQRGSLRKIEESLNNSDVLWQILCLRLAVIICHARVDVNLQDMQLQKTSDNQAQLLMDADWKNNYPRAVHLLQQESENWKRSGLLALEI
jgi:exopolyphosphatase / guanosine-5'-triphosphate,3'-diphosphate pyrophosphatase